MPRFDVPDDDTVHPDDEQLLRLLASSSDLDRPREQLHFMFFASENAARQALTRVLEHDWQQYGDVLLIPEDEATPGIAEHRWAVMVSRRDMPTNARTIPLLRSYFTEVCADLGGLYDGWEAATDEKGRPEHRPGAPDAPQIESLGDDELELLVRLRELARKLGLAGDMEAIQRMFREERSGWHAAAPETRSDPGAVIHTLGAACGDIIAERLGLEWARLKDGRGTEFALVDDDGRGVTVCPINAVNKRWADEDEPGLDDYVAGVIDWAEEN